MTDCTGKGKCGNWASAKESYDTSTALHTSHLKARSEEVATSIHHSYRLCRVSCRSQVYPSSHQSHPEAGLES